MSDYISKDRAIRIAEQGQVQGYEWQFTKLVNEPSVDVRENIHGEWFAITQPWTDTQIFQCTCCGRHIEIPQYEVSTLTIRYPFCHCGADMRGEI